MALLQSSFVRMGSGKQPSYKGVGWKRGWSNFLLYVTGAWHPTSRTSSMLKTTAPSSSLHWQLASETSRLIFC